MVATTNLNKVKAQVVELTDDQLTDVKGELALCDSYLKMSFTYLFYAILPVHELESLNLKSDDHPDWERVNAVTTQIVIFSGELGLGNWRPWPVDRKKTKAGRELPENECDSEFFSREHKLSQNGVLQCVLQVEA